MKGHAKMNITDIIGDFIYYISSNPILSIIILIAGNLFLIALSGLLANETKLLKFLLISSTLIIMLALVIAFFSYFEELLIFILIIILIAIFILVYFILKKEPNEEIQKNNKKHKKAPNAYEIGNDRLAVKILKSLFLGGFFIFLVSIIVLMTTFFFISEPNEEPYLIIQDNIDLQVNIVIEPPQNIAIPQAIQDSSLIIVETDLKDTKKVYISYLLHSKKINKNKQTYKISNYNIGFNINEYLFLVNEYLFLGIFFILLLISIITLIIIFHYVNLNEIPIEEAFRFIRRKIVIVIDTINTFLTLQFF